MEQKESRITLEEEKKLLPKSYIEKLNNIQALDPTLHDIKNSIIKQLESLILPMAQDIQFRTEKEMNIKEIVESEVLNDLYETDPVTHLIQDYIKLSKNYDLKRESFIRILIDGFIDFIDKCNIVNSPKTYTTFVAKDDEVISEQDRLLLIAKVNPLIDYWNNKGINAKKVALYQIMKNYATTPQRFVIIDDQFQNRVGERILTKEKKRIEKENMEKQLLEQAQQKEKENQQ